MKLTIHMEYEVDDHDAGRELVNEVMPALYKSDAPSPDGWTWEVEDED